MKLIMDYVLLDDNDQAVKEPIPGSDGKELRDLTLRSLLRQTVNGPCVGDDKPNTEEKMSRYYLAVNLKSDAYDLSIDDLALLKKCVENRTQQLPTVLFGQVMLLIEGKDPLA